MGSSEPLNPQIVKASKADLPSISQLAGVIWRAHYPGIISAEQIEYMLGRMYSLETMWEEISQGGVRYDLLLVGDGLAGFAAFGPSEDAHVFKLHKIYVLPAQHGRGLGSLLLRHCEGEAAKAGARRLVLTVNKRNTKAMAAYLRNGFVLVDSVVADIGGGFVMDDYVLQKSLAVHPA